MVNVYCGNKCIKKILFLLLRAHSHNNNTVQHAY